MCQLLDDHSSRLSASIFDGCGRRPGVTQQCSSVDHVTFKDETPSFHVVLLGAAQGGCVLFFYLRKSGDSLVVLRGAQVFLVMSLAWAVHATCVATVLVKVLAGPWERIV